MDRQRFKYCVIGNIVRTHVDVNGTLRHGTAAYTGGTKVFLCGKYWRLADREINVIGHTRGKKYQVHAVPVSLIENVRCGRTFRPWVLNIMDNWEYCSEWWHDSEKDRKATEDFVSVWNRRDELNRLTDCVEIKKYTSVYFDSGYQWFHPDHTQLTFDSESGCFLGPARKRVFDIVERLTDDRVMVKLREPADTPAGGESVRE